MKKLLLTLALSVALASCAAPAPKPAELNLNFSSLGLVRLDVGKINVIDRTTPPLRQSGPVLRPTVTEAIYRWANDRLQAVGASGQAVLMIKEASMTAQPLSVSNDFNSWFTRQQSHKYTAKIELDLQARAANGQTSAFATAQAMRSTTLPEDPTEAEKTQAYNELLDGLMRDLNQNMDQAIRTHMTPFIAR